MAGGATPSLVTCVHADRCAGCPLIDLPYEAQLGRKRDRVKRAAGRYPGLAEIAVEATAGAEPVVGYRTRAKLMASGGRLGLYAKSGGHEVVDIPQCLVLSPAIARVAEAVRRLPPPAWLRAVDLREVQDQGEARVLATLVVTRGEATSPGRELAESLMREAPEVAGVAANYHEGASPQVLGSDTKPLAGLASAPDRLGASVTLATFGSFVQAHRGQAARVHAMLAEAIGRAAPREGGRPRPRVLDLFGGSGAIALGLAARGATVLVVESFGPAVAQARAAARAQGANVEAIHGDAAVVVRSLSERGEQFDAVVVNPPRRGLSPEVREGVARLGAQVVAYVSCDPETLARDLDHLRRLGYAASRLAPLDMIPLTEEVETVAVLERSPPPPPRVVYADDDVIVADKAPHESTTPRGEHDDSLLARVRRVPGGAEGVPVHRLDAGTSGLVVFARRADLAGAWQAALGSADARKVYLAAVRGVAPAKRTRPRFRRLFVAAGHSVLRVEPEQGRTDPPRRFLAALGHPVLGDERYGHAPSNRYFEEKFGLDRPFLHCARLELVHPRTGAALALEAAIPGDLAAVAERAFGRADLTSRG
jgi:23S rRNA (uracil1939-C5)-methyltransferase